MIPLLTSFSHICLGHLAYSSSGPRIVVPVEWCRLPAIVPVNTWERQVVPFRSAGCPYSASIPGWRTPTLLITIEGYYYT